MSTETLKSMRTSLRALDFRMDSRALCLRVQVLSPSFKGNPVGIGDGPAAVIGDERRTMPLAQRTGQGRRGQ
jgi:hypothetical protein